MKPYCLPQNTPTANRKIDWPLFSSNIIKNSCKIRPQSPFWISPLKFCFCFILSSKDRLTIHLCFILPFSLFGNLFYLDICITCSFNEALFFNTFLPEKLSPTIQYEMYVSTMFLLLVYLHCFTHCYCLFDL